MNLNEAYSMVTDKLSGWLDTFIKMLPNLLISVIIVVVAWLVARLVRKLIRKGLNRFSESISLNNLIATIGYITVLAVGTFVALSVLHLDKAVTSLLAGVGVLGLALGFAFQDIAANFVSGVMMATRKPYRIGDLIESQGYMGHIVKMSLRSTTIRTFQGQDAIIPNKDLFQNPVTNYTIFPKRRIDLECGVSYGEDLKNVRNVALKAIQSLNMLDKSQEVTLFFHTFGDSSINFSVRYWVDECAQSKYLTSKSEGVIALKQAFDSADIMIPFPITTVDFGIKGGRSLDEVKFDFMKELELESK